MKRKKGKRLLVALLAASVALTSIPASVIAAGETIYGEEETIRVSSNVSSDRETNFNSDWKFYLGTSSTAQNQNFDDSNWKSVTLPHDFSISQNFTTSGEAESGFLPGGTGWYRKSFTLPASDADQKFVLNFDGIYSDAYVYVNGTYVGEHHYGYSAFAFDITDYITCDGATENVVAVKVVNNIPSSRWYSGSGIYRDVTLVVTDPVHIAQNGIYVTTPDIANGTGTVQTAVEVKNESDKPVEVTVKNTVYTNDGVQASATAESTVDMNASATQTVNANPVVSSPKLWSIDNPNLYFLHTEVYADGTLTDSYDTTFGFRWFSFDSERGFYLNGDAVKLNGVCLHHDQGAAGSAAYYDAMYRQLVSMKEMGANAIRTSHNPADEQFIEICNELGLLVIEEIFDGWSYAKNGNSNDFARYFKTAISSSNNILDGNSSMTWAEYVTKSVVKRDRNNPSIILWSLGNEIQEGASSDSTYPTIAQNLIDWIEEVDTTRPSTIGDNSRPTNTNSYLGQVLNVIKNNGGVLGFNYANSSSTLSSLHNYWGTMYASETSSHVNSRGIYTTQESRANADGKFHLTSYDTSAVTWGITAHESIYNTLTADYVAGEFVWTGWDYIGEPTPWNGTNLYYTPGSGATPNSSYFGIVDTAGFEKDTYYLYRSQWKQDDTTLHLVTAWDSDNYMLTNGKTPVVVYSNAPKVELYRNGTLVGTATRKVNTTTSGHEYYTYTTASNNSSYCTAVSGSGSTSLYATFNVSYEAGTLSAIAYDANGKEIANTAGKKVVSTPGSVSKLAVTQSKAVVNADDQSLVYIEVEVQDANGNLDTTATNTINFNLSGNGEIVGVDNGDQGTTAKYQQSSVLTSKTSAQIAAYAGKAIVIVKSTDEAGQFTVNVTSSGLTGGNANVTTNALSEEVTEGLINYTMVRDYSVTVGTKPELLTTATGTLADGTIVTGTIKWDEVTEDIYGTAGDYSLTGTLQFEGEEAITVIAKLHVIDNIIALRNVSTITTPSAAPTLPSTVKGVLGDGTLSGEFNVTWENVSGTQFATVGDIVTVNGTATIIGDTTLPVTCTVRVTEAVNTESTNVAPKASSLTQDIETAYQSDNLASIINGNTTFEDNTNERWTNWANRTRSAKASLTFGWDTAQVLSGVNLYYYYDNCCAYPEDIVFEYSLNGNDYKAVEYVAEQVETASLGAKYAYTFEEVINPIAVRITFTQQNGTSGNSCVGLIEAEMMTFAGKLEYNSSADLNSITVDGTAIDNFNANTLQYEADGTSVAATTDDNAGITVLPVDENGVVRILTVSEDGTAEKIYEVVVGNTPACTHMITEVVNATPATCTAEGYTGDTRCTECGAVVEKGAAIAATGHSTVLRNETSATCTTEGYTGDHYCTICESVVEAGAAIAATGHSWNQGVVTKEPTETEEGVMTYTCTVCDATKTAAIDKVKVELKAPEVTLKVTKGSSSRGIKLTGKFEDYTNSDSYYKVTDHGFVYITNARLGTKTLTVNTSGRSKVSVKGYNSDGSYASTIKASNNTTKYTFRAYLIYTNEDGKSVYVYSDPVSTNYSSLK